MYNEKQILKFMSSRKAFSIDHKRSNGYVTREVDDWCEKANSLIINLTRDVNRVTEENHVLEEEITRVMNDISKPENSRANTDTVDRSRSSDPHHLVKRVSNLEKELANLKRKLDRINKNK